MGRGEDEVICYVRFRLAVERVDCVFLKFIKFLNRKEGNILFL